MGNNPFREIGHKGIHDKLTIHLDAISGRILTSLNIMRKIQDYSVCDGWIGDGIEWDITHIQATSFRAAANKFNKLRRKPYLKVDKDWAQERKMVHKGLVFEWVDFRSNEEPEDFVCVVAGHLNREELLEFLSDVRGQPENMDGCLDVFDSIEIK